MARERSAFNGRLLSSRAIREEPMPRYKCKSIAALDIALGGLPAKMHVEADVGTGVSAKTVGELRKVTTWSENLVITTPQERHPESGVKISKASVATRCPSRKSHPRVAMMQSGQDWCGDDAPRSLDVSSYRGVFAQPQVRDL